MKANWTMMKIHLLSINLWYRGYVFGNSDMDRQ
jgi:hypothetical protein